MPYITTGDGTEIYYTDHGDGRPVLLSHGWPLSSDAWAREMKLIADAGFRAIAHDRRGHGRSSKTYEGNDMDTYAADLNDIVLTLDLRDLVLIGHSTGGGEVIRYAARYGRERVAKIFVAGAIPPIMLRSESNPHGTPIEALDAIRRRVLDDAAQYWLELADPFLGANRPGSTVSQGDKDDFWRQAQCVNIAAAYDGIKAFSETDFTDDLRALEVPVFIAHGGDDQIVPLAASAETSIALVENGTLKIYPGAPHGITGDYRMALDEDIIAFLSR
jgi:non-heme chloroperoxidase